MPCFPKPNQIVILSKPSQTVIQTLQRSCFCKYDTTHNPKASKKTFKDIHTVKHLT